MITPEQKELIFQNIEQPRTKHFAEFEGELQTKLTNIVKLLESIKREDYLDKYCVYYENELFIHSIETEEKDGVLEITGSQASKVFRLDTTYTTKELAELYLSQRGCFENGLDFGYQAFDVNDERDNPGYAEAYNEDGTLKEKYQFKSDNVYDAVTDIFYTLYSKLETAYIEAEKLIEEESKMEQNDDLYIFEEMISYKAYGSIENEEEAKSEKAKEVIKTISMDEETVYSEIQFKNNTSLDDSDRMNFNLYQDNEAFSKLVNDNGYINRMFNHLKRMHNINHFYIIAKNDDKDDYIFYTVDKHNEVEFFVMLTANNLNEVQIERLGVKNNYILKEHYKKSIAFKRTMNNF